jgi:uncharacterized protein (TIGR03066 family)
MNRDAVLLVAREHRMTAWLLRAGLLVCLLPICAGADESDKPDNAARLVGKWQVAKSGGEPPVGFTMEFDKEGRFKFTTPNKSGKQMIIEGAYKVDGDKLQITVKKGDKEEPPATLTIKKLAAQQMTLQAGNNVAQLKRVK